MGFCLVVSRVGGGCDKAHHSVGGERSGLLLVADRCVAAGRVRYGCWWVGTRLVYTCSPMSLCSRCTSPTLVALRVSATRHCDERNVVSEQI